LQRMTGEQGKGIRRWVTKEDGCIKVNLDP
jgi:hypothetical protein